MFLKNSRYYQLATVTVRAASGQNVTAVKFRRLPVESGQDAVAQGTDRLDIMASTRYGDAARYWHIADANSELEAEKLVTPVGRIIQVPEK